jgi:hypothetical protein
MMIAPACRDPLILRDEMHYTMMERGSIRLRSAIEAMRGGKTAPEPRYDVMWLVPRQPVGKPRDLVPETIVRQHRDPCPFCAVRADIGCKHRRVA